MNDRLKIRFFDTYNKIMSYPEIDRYGNLVYLANKNIYFSLPKLLLNKKRFKPMQCTGLKDKNGNLIFEGDIVKYGSFLYIIRFGTYNKNSWADEKLMPAYHSPCFYLETISEQGMLSAGKDVKKIRPFESFYTHKDFAVKYPMNSEFTNEESFLQKYGLEVVGNIYQNPELLEAKQ